jgi:hypothetical protein
MEPGSTNLSLRDLPQIDTASSCRYCKHFVASTTDLPLLPPSGSSQIAPRKREEEEEDWITVGRLLSLQSTAGILVEAVNHFGLESYRPGIVPQ